jgi:hypothetical protein
MRAVLPVYSPRENPWERSFIEAIRAFLLLGRNPTWRTLTEEGTM